MDNVNVMGLYLLVFYMCNMVTTARLLRDLLVPALKTLGKSSYAVALTLSCLEKIDKGAKK